MKRIISSVVLWMALLAMTGCQTGKQSEKEKYQVKYVQDSKEDKKQTKQADADKSPQEISDQEGNHEEQIVVEITDAGYVTSHGDHYHFFNGKVPYDAILSEKLLLEDPSYQLEDSDKVSETEDGFIIKKDGKYHLFLKEGSQKVNIRPEKVQ